MKQVQFTFRDDETLHKELRVIRQWYKSKLFSTVLIQIFTEILNKELIERVCGQISVQLPEALIVGCSSNGNILNGKFSGGSFAVICTLFEYPSTKVEVFQYPISADTQKEVTDKLCKEVCKRPWVKGVGMFVTIRGMSVTALCEGLSRLPEGVQVFGGGAFSEDLEKNEACVFSNVGGYQEKSVLFTLFGGEELFLESSFLTGWKPLGSFLNVTAAQGEFLKELNGRPAYETYYKYLHIKNDESFFYNTLEFPFLYQCNGIEIMRAPTASNPDGSLTMTADISEGVRARIAYGDPWTILDSAWQEGNRLLSFAPECIQVFSCAARRTFWGNLEVGKETEPYQIVAPTFGFYTSGEFLRSNGYVNQHNVTQVLVAMREGEAKPHPEKQISLANRTFEGKISMINRMAMFIKATTEELEEANRKLQEANKKLSELAVIDTLTGVGNKNAYFEKVKLIEGREDMEYAVAAFDMNGLKAINDSYGHEVGDRAISKAAAALSAVFGAENVYRIGGDEFIALLLNRGEEEMRELFARLDREVDRRNEEDPGIRVGISKGFSVCAAGSGEEYKETVCRADKIMYADKSEYYKWHDRHRR